LAGKNVSDMTRFYFQWDIKPELSEHQCEHGCPPWQRFAFF